MLKSKTTIQNHKRKQIQMNQPTSHNSEAPVRPSVRPFVPYNNTNHPFQAPVRPSVPYNNTNRPFQAPVQPSVPYNTNHQFQPSIRPSFLYEMRQNSLSSSSLPASVGPTMHHNSSSSSSSSYAQSSQSRPTVHEPTLHQSSSSNSLMSHEQDILSEVEVSLADQYEQNLLSEVEIIDGNGNIIRIQKMTAKDVYKLKGDEKVLTHVNKHYQLIKNSAGLCSRFMTLILSQPSLCPPDVKDWKACKKSCASMLMAELRRRFSIPQGETIDRVLANMFSERRRNVKHRLKSSLCQQAANKLNEANGINGLDAQEKVYTDDELLAALDLLETPENFTEHQWRVYKSNVRDPKAKKLSICGKKARKEHVHTHTTGAVSFARKKDIFLVENKREANDVESFHICYKTKDGTYIQEATRDMMVKANRHLSSKIKELGGHERVGTAEVENIAREVLNKLFGNEKPHCYGAGVTKSQVSKFCCDLRRMRGAVVADENRLLLEKVENQAKEIQTHKKQFETCNKELETCKKQLVSQNKKVESYSKQLDTQGLQLKNMEQKLNEVFGMLKGYPAFPNQVGVASTSATTGTTGTCVNQPCSSPSPFMGEDHYSPVMDEDHYSPVMEEHRYSSVMDDPSFTF